VVFQDWARSFEEMVFERTLNHDERGWIEVGSDRMSSSMWLSLHFIPTVTTFDCLFKSCVYVSSLYYGLSQYIFSIRIWGHEVWPFLDIHLLLLLFATLTHTYDSEMCDGVAHCYISRSLEPRSVS
jgi:hypothetical protein